MAFSDIGDFGGFWRSGDGNTRAGIAASDSEAGDGYGCGVYLHDGCGGSCAEYSTHGLYNGENGRPGTAGSVTINRLNADGGYGMEMIPSDPAELIISPPAPFIRRSGFFDFAGCGKHAAFRKYVQHAG